MHAEKSTADKELALTSLARALTEELRYPNYPKEWSAEPLSGLLAFLYNALNLHPGKLGDIIKDSYSQTVPTLRKGNVNQLSELKPEYFAKTKKYYTDAYAIKKIASQTKITHVNLSGNIAAFSSSTEGKILIDLAIALLKVFSQLDTSQENEHRTLEHISYALTPVCYTFDLIGIGFDIAEYADQWRSLSQPERKRLHDDIISRW